jgi:hypothetical protein
MNRPAQRPATPTSPFTTCNLSACLIAKHNQLSLKAMNRLQATTLTALLASCLSLVLGCIDYGLNRNYAIGLNAERLTTGDKPNSVNALRAIVQTKLLEMGYVQLRSNSNAWRKSELRVDLVEDPHGSLILNTWAFGGARTVRKGAELDMELVSALGSIRGVVVSNQIVQSSN